MPPPAPQPHRPPCTARLRDGLPRGRRGLCVRQAERDLGSGRNNGRTAEHGPGQWASAEGMLHLEMGGGGLTGQRPGLC